MKCDFCGSPAVQWLYPCQNFDIGAVVIPEFSRVGRKQDLLNSTSDWAACYECAGYIQKKDYFFLARRCARIGGDDLVDMRLWLFTQFEHYRKKDEFRRLA